MPYHDVSTTTPPGSLNSTSTTGHGLCCCRMRRSLKSALQFSVNKDPSVPFNGYFIPGHTVIGLALPGLKHHGPVFAWIYCTTSGFKHTLQEGSEA